MALLLASNDGFLPAVCQNSRRRQLDRRAGRNRYAPMLDALPEQCTVEGTDALFDVEEVERGDGILHFDQEKIRVPHRDISAVMTIEEGEMALNRGHVELIIERGQQIGEDTKYNDIYEFDGMLLYIPNYYTEDPSRLSGEILVKAKRRDANGCAVRASFFTR